MDDIVKQYIKEIVEETLEKQHIQEYKNRIEELEKNVMLLDEASFNRHHIHTKWACASISTIMSQIKEIQVSIKEIKESQISLEVNEITDLQCKMNEHMETLELISHETNKLKEIHNNLETTVQKHTEMLQKLETSVDYKNIHDILLVDEYIELINLEIKKISVLNNKNMIQILCGKIAQIEDNMEDKIKIIIDNL